MTAEDAVQIASWRYEDPWSVYDLVSSAEMLNRLGRHWAVTDVDGDLTGFCCVGGAARVPGLARDSAILDVGVGMNPRHVGQGDGQAFGAVVLDHLNRLFPRRPMRAVIRCWNTRSQRFARSLGFIDVGGLSAPDDEQHDSLRVWLKPNAESSQGFVVARFGTWLFGTKLMLREFVSTDEQSIHAYAANPVVTRFMDWGPNSMADTRAFLAGAIAQRQAGERSEYALAAVHLASGATIGSGAISVTSARRRSGELGYVIHPDFWSQGHATEVAESLVRFGFDHLGLRRIQATCHPHNHASARVLLKAGLRCEGLVRRDSADRGAGGDSLLYSVTDDYRRMSHQVD